MLDRCDNSVLFMMIYGFFSGFCFVFVCVCVFIVNHRDICVAKIEFPISDKLVSICGS